jgi:hypothetical protein
MLGVCEKSVRRLIARGLLKTSRALRHHRVTGKRSSVSEGHHVTAALAGRHEATVARDANLSATPPAVWGVSRRIGSASV